MTIHRKSVEACELSPEGLPTCSTGPLGRLIWMVRELADLVGLRPRRGRAR